MKSQKIYAIPDIFGRIVLTGTCKNVLSYTSDPLKNILVRADWAKATTIYKGYTITGIVLTSPTVLSANYYDSYECMGLNGIPASSDANFKAESLADYGLQHAASSKGMLTASMTALLDGSTTMLYSIMYYDNRGRLIQTKANNHLPAGVEKEY